MKKLIVLLLSFVFITGCSAFGEKKTTVCKGMFNGVETEIVLVSKDNDVLQESWKVATDYNSLKYTKEYMEEYGQATKESYERINGLKYEFEFKEDLFYEKITIDFQTGDYKELKDYHLIATNSEEDKQEKINYEKVVETFTHMGMVFE